MPFRTFKHYDIFISYVVEDRDIVEALYDKLTALGFRVWYARNELYAGVQIRPLINNGLENARYGIVVISPDSNSHWIQGELFVLMKKEGMCLPVLHNTTVETMAQTHPEIITVYCLNTSSGIDNVIKDITKTVKLKSTGYYAFADTLFYLRKNARKVLYLFLCLCIMALLGLSYWIHQSRRPSEEIIETAIRQRIDKIQNMAEKEFQEGLIQNNGSLSSINAITAAWQQVLLSSPATYHRNKIHFENGYETIRTITGIETEGIVASIDPPFGLSEYRVYQFKHKHTGTLQSHYALYNMLTLYPQITGTRHKDSVFEVEVQYTNPLRYIEVHTIIDTETETEHRDINLYGVKQHEIMVFEKKGNTWSLIQVR